MCHERNGGDRGSGALRGEGGGGGLRGHRVRRRPIYTYIYIKTVGFGARGAENQWKHCGVERKRRGKYY